MSAVLDLFCPHNTDNPPESEMRDIAERHDTIAALQDFGLGVKRLFSMANNGWLGQGEDPGTLADD